MRVYTARRAGRAIALFTCEGREGRKDEGRMEGKQARFSISREWASTRGMEDVGYCLWKFSL